MKQQIKSLILPLAALLILFSACSKNGDDNPPTKTALLTSGSWKFKSATANGSDVSGVIQSCQKDNILSFSPNLNGNVAEGATKCNSGDPDNNPFTWAFASAETEITVSSPLFTNGGTTFTLVTLTAAELVVQMPYNPPVGASVLMTVTFIH